MFKINFSTVYNRKKKLNKKGTALIHIRANQKGKNQFFSTEISIAPKYWNNQKKEIRNAHPQHITLNREIDKLKNKLIDLSVKILERKNNVSLDLLKTAYYNKSKYNNSFLDFFSNELNNLANIGTYYDQKATLTRLKEYKKDVFFSDLDFEFITNFAEFLRTKKLHHNTVMKHLHHFKKYLQIAINKELFEIQNNPFLKFKFSRTSTKRAFLKTHEIKKILNYILPLDKSKEMQLVFDVFLFAFYTGLRISDILNLKKSSIKVDIKNGYYIETDMIKTGEFVFIPIEKIFNTLNLEVPKYNQPVEIIKRNKKKDNNFIFAELHRVQRYSDLKQVFELAKVKYVGFHGARHSIAMFLLNDIGLDLTSIGQILGHKDIQTTAIYSSMSNKGLINRLEIVHNQRTTQNSQNKAM